MTGAIQKIKSFFGGLREKNEQEKKRWIIGLTSASMLIVLALWAISMNSTIKKLSGPEKTEAETGFTAALSKGAGVVGGKIGKVLSEMSDKIQSYIATTNSVTIQPTNLDFSKNIDTISPQKLP